MRIIGGTYRGRKLRADTGRSIRPTTDRVKKTIFDILVHTRDLANAEILDLFAGTGSLGLEAISRGAGHVTFVDNSEKSLAVLESNIRTLGCESACTVYRADVFWFLKRIKRHYDVVFVDPPYKLQELPSLPEAIRQSGALGTGSHVVMEYERNTQVIIPEGSFQVDRRPFGQTVLLMLRTNEPTGPPNEETLSS